MSVKQVWKLGGTSVDTAEKRALLGRKVAGAAGLELGVVVSAVAGETDRLTREISANSDVPQHIVDHYVATGERRSAALVAAAICAAGRDAEVIPPTLLFSCNGRFGDADVLEVDTEPILDCFGRGVVPVVPGFFGRTSDGRDCLLGRGGSDYSAVLLGAALRATVVLLKNDCDGVYDADPNKVAGATRFDRLSHDQALALAARGARVLNGKAALVAMREGVTVVVRSTFGTGAGTLIAADPGPMGRPFEDLDAATHQPAGRRVDAMPRS